MPPAPAHPLFSIGDKGSRLLPGRAPLLPGSSYASAPPMGSATGVCLFVGCTPVPLTKKGTSPTYCAALQACIHVYVMCLAPAFDPSECWPRVCCLRSCVQPQLQHTRPARTILRRVESDRRRRRCGLPQVPYGDAGHEDAAQPAGLERVAGSRSDEQSHRHGNLGAARRGQQRCGRSQRRRPPGPVMV